MDNGLLDKRTISIESIIAPTRFIASIVLEIIVGVRTAGHGTLDCWTRDTGLLDKGHWTKGNHCDGH